MQEVALLLSSLAGIATAVAVRARTKNTHQLLTLSASSQIQNQIKTLKIEKEILAKTVTRLYQSKEWETMPREHKEKLLARYQHQLSIVMARLEKLEDSKNHPDLGPVGDGLVTLMDQKLSSLDTKMYDIATKVADIKATQELSESKKDEKASTEIARSKLTNSTKDTQAQTTSHATKDVETISPTPNIPRVGLHSPGSFEITTLTSIPSSSKFTSYDTPKPKNTQSTATDILVPVQQQPPASNSQQQPKRVIINPEIQNVRRQVRATPEPIQKKIDQKATQQYRPKINKPSKPKITQPQPTQPQPTQPQPTQPQPTQPQPTQPQPTQPQPTQPQPTQPQPTQPQPTQPQPTQPQPTQPQPTQPQPTQPQPTQPQPTQPQPTQPQPTQPQPTQPQPTQPQPTQPQPTQPQPTQPQPTQPQPTQPQPTQPQPTQPQPTQPQPTQPQPTQPQPEIDENEDDEDEKEIRGIMKNIKETLAKLDRAESE